MSNCINQHIPSDDHDKLYNLFQDTPAYSQIYPKDNFTISTHNLVMFPPFFRVVIVTGNKWVGGRMDTNMLGKQSTNSNSD